MERFIRRENIKRYRKLLREAKDGAERQRILKLLAEEERKEQKAGSTPARSSPGEPKPTAGAARSARQKTLSHEEK